MKQSTKEAVKTALADAKAAASKRYASIRESEQGRMMTDAGIVGASALASGFIEGAYPDMSVNLGGMDVPYTALAGAGAMLLPGASREVRAGGYGAVLAFGVLKAREAGEEWAAK